MTRPVVDTARCGRSSAAGSAVTTAAEKAGELLLLAVAGGAVMRDMIIEARALHEEGTLGLEILRQVNLQAGRVEERIYVEKSTWRIQ